jgi:predicted secreted protein
MNWTSIIAIYSLFWVMSAFLVMPFGVRTSAEAGVDLVPGQAESAPAQWRPGRVALRATVLSLVLFGLYYANYVNGWIGPQDLNFIGSPPETGGGQSVERQI